MKIRREQKLFIGMKVDASMKRQIDEGDTKGRPIFKSGDPAHLDSLKDGDDLYLGRVIDGGFPLDQLNDLQRNIRSIVRVSFPEGEGSSAVLRIFAVDAELGLSFGTIG